MIAGSHTVHVNLAGSPYDIHIAPRILSEIGPRIAALAPRASAALITDSNVAPHFATAVRSSLAATNVRLLAEHIFPAGEENKTFEQITRAYDTLLSARIERSTIIIALGGGVVGDMAGFIAATVLRGIPFVQVPTTLLSMVDASVGGKTGVNTAAGKNLVGAFHQPIAVLADPNVLTTLPPREIVSGLAECIKHEIIRDADGFSALENSLDAILKLDPVLLSNLIAHNVRIKARVVEIDPFEHGERAHLNFGHTFGHAIEKVSNFSYSHGESVALGMVAATHLARGLGLLDEISVQRILALLARAHLPTGQMKLDPQTVHRAMYTDKKVTDKRLRLILPDRIGHVIIRDDVPADLVQAAIEKLR